MARTRGLNLEQVLAHYDPPIEVHACCLDPHSLGNRRIFRRHEMRKDQSLDAGLPGNPSNSPMLAAITDDTAAVANTPIIHSSTPEINPA